jgi:ABC transporter binding protein (urea carboxylase system)
MSSLRRNLPELIFRFFLETTVMAFRFPFSIAVFSLPLVLGIVGCSTSSKTSPASTPDSESPPGTEANEGAASSGAEESSPPPVFSLAWSEYPSWSVFGVADELGILEGEEGKLGEVEKKFGVDIVLREADYSTCMNMFGSGECDAVCITNMDALAMSPTREGVAVLPTSTSNGADACIVTEGIKSAEDLKGKPVYGLKASVSEYCFGRCLEKRGLNPADFQFTNEDPANAALEMQQGTAGKDAIMVWNPFVLQTLHDRPDTHVLFDSSEIPGEIVDMVVVGKDVLAKPKADIFVKAVAEAYYRMNQELASSERGDELLVALGKKFSNLGLEQMKQAVVQTRFYTTPDEARALLTGQEFQDVMKNVAKFCVDAGLVKEASYSFGSNDDGSRLRFDASLLP